MKRYSPKERFIFEIEGERFLYEPDTMNVYDIDELTERMLSQGEPVTREEVIARFSGDADAAEVEELFDGLVELGLLRDRDNAPKPIEPACSAKEAPYAGVGCLVLDIAQVCNMKCSYCFASHGTYNQSAILMSRETAEKAIDFQFEVSKGLEILEVYFFGGEPLMNADVLLYAVDYAKKKAASLGKRVKFSTTTNGTILDDKILDCLDENHFTMYVSFDGPPELQNSQRGMCDGSGSHETVLANLRRIVERKNIFVGCRATMMDHRGDLKRIDDYFNELGLCYYHVEPATSWDFKDGSCGSIDESSIRTFLEDYGGVMKNAWSHIEKEEFLGYRNFLIEVERLCSRAPRSCSCSLGSSMLSVAANGDLYNCHRLVGTDGQSIGSVYDPDMARRFEPHIPVTTDKREDCGSCWARNICGGDCAAESILHYGNESQTMPCRCELHKEKLKWHIWIYSKINRTFDQEKMDRIIRSRYYSYKV